MKQPTKQELLKRVFELMEINDKLCAIIDMQNKVIKELQKEQTDGK